MGLTSLTLQARGDATPEQAWERYARIALWPTWSPQIASVQCSEARIADDVHGVVRAVGGLPVPFRIQTVDESARKWTWTARVALVPVRLTHQVCADGEGCRTRLTIHLPPPLAAVYAPLALVALRRLVRR